MGQYHLIVNLDKKEFLNPRTYDIGLKALEQLNSFPSTPQALFVLLMCSNGRGKGDLEPVPYASGEPVIGRWSGDRIAVIGDYAKEGDIKNMPSDPISRIHHLCDKGVYRDISHLVYPTLHRNTKGD